MASKIAVIRTGGTISCVETEKGAVPCTDAGEFVPAHTDETTIIVENLFSKPSNELLVAEASTLREEILKLEKTGVDGIIVTHGTDTMAEMAYFLDLTTEIEVPIVLTGAQRRADETSPDGPSNITTGAMAVENRNVTTGVYVAFNDQLHAARHVEKVHTSKLEAFASPNACPVAERYSGGLRFLREPKSYSEYVPFEGLDASVRIVKMSLGVDGTQIHEALEANCDGIVVEAMGLGNTTASAGEAIVAAIESNVTVVITSRCHQGPVSPVYGSSGGGKELHEKGAIFARELSSPKARLKLLVALGSPVASSALREIF